MRVNFSRVFGHGHRPSRVGHCVENEHVPILRGSVPVPRPGGGQRHAGKHTKSDGSAQLNNSGHGTTKTFNTLEKTISIFDVLSQTNLMFWDKVVS